MGNKIILYIIFTVFYSYTFANTGIPFKNIRRGCQSSYSFPCELTLLHSATPSTPYLSDTDWGVRFASHGYNASLTHTFAIRKFCCACIHSIKQNCPQCYMSKTYSQFNNINFCSVLYNSDYINLFAAYRYASAALKTYPTGYISENITVYTSERAPYDFSTFGDDQTISSITFETCHIRTVTYRYDPLSNLCVNVYEGNTCPKSTVDSCSPISFLSESAGNNIICHYKPLVSNPIAYNFSHNGNTCYQLSENRYISSYNYYLQYLYNNSIEYNFDSLPSLKIYGGYYEVSLISPNYFDQVFRRSLREKYKYNPLKLTNFVNAVCVKTKVESGLYYNGDSLMLITNVDCQVYIPYNLTHYICESFYLLGHYICEPILFRPFDSYDLPVTNILKSVIRKREIEINEPELYNNQLKPSLNDTIKDPEAILSTLLNNTFSIFNNTAINLLEHFFIKNNCSDKNSSTFCALQGIVDYSIKQLNDNFNLTMVQIVSKLKEKDEITCSMKEEDSECKYRNLLDYTLKTFNDTLTDSVFLFVKLLVGNTTYVDSYGVKHTMLGGWIADGFAALIRPFYDVFVATLKFIISICVELLKVYSDAVVKGFADIMDAIAQLISTLLRILLSIIVVLESKFLILEYSVLFMVLMKYLNRDLWSSLIVLIVVILIFGIERKSPSLLLYVVHDSFYYSPLINYSVDSFDYNYYVMYRNNSVESKNLLF